MICRPVRLASAELLNNNDFMYRKYKIGAVLMVAAVLGLFSWFYFYRNPFSFSDNGGVSLEDAIIISGPDSSNAKAVIDKGIGKYLYPYGTAYRDYGIRGISDFIAQNGRRYIRILEEEDVERPSKFRIFYFDVTDILGNKAKAYQSPIGGGDGSSPDFPVVLSVAMANDLEAAENFIYQHLEDMYGIFGKDWQYISDSASQGNPDTGERSWATYKKINIKLSDGSEKSVYFDVTDIPK